MPDIKEQDFNSIPGILGKLGFDPRSIVSEVGDRKSALQVMKRHADRGDDEVLVAMLSLASAATHGQASADAGRASIRAFIDLIISRRQQAQADALVGATRTLRDTLDVVAAEARQQASRIEETRAQQAKVGEEQAEIRAKLDRRENRRIALWIAVSGIIGGIVGAIIGPVASAYFSGQIGSAPPLSPPAASAPLPQPAQPSPATSPASSSSLPPQQGNTP